MDPISRKCFDLARAKHRQLTGYCMETTPNWTSDVDFSIHYHVPSFLLFWKPRDILLINSDNVTNRIDGMCVMLISIHKPNTWIEAMALIRANAVNHMEGQG